MEVVFYIYFAFSAIFSIAFLYKKDRKFMAILFGIVYGMIILPLTLGIIVQKVVDLIEEAENKK